MELTLPEIWSIPLAAIIGAVGFLVTAVWAASKPYNKIMSQITAILDRMQHMEARNAKADAEPERDGQAASPAHAAGAANPRGAIGVNNTEAISGLTGKIGMPAIWGATVPDDPQTRDFRIYRSFVELPEVSGRDPLTVLDSDWDQNWQRFA